jgi:gamma-glutamyl:cysteine ligase YbdK (ATP-grasp superfamily)
MYYVDKDQQRQMEEAFERQLRERCHPAPTSDSRPLPVQVGVETEYLLVDAHNNLISEAQRNRVLEALDHSSPELGVSTIETHTDPVPLIDDGGACSLLREMQRVEDETIAVARRQGCSLVRMGAYPGSFAHLAVTQTPDRYQRLLDISHTLHGVDDNTASTVQIGEIQLPYQRCDVMSGCQSIHINMQVTAGETAIALLNRCIEMVPYLLALTANSPLLNCRPSGYKEVRVPLWEPLFTFPHIDAYYGVNTRRTGFPDYYYRGWDDYWRDVGRKLYMTHDPDEAFDSNVKQFWRTVRLKPCPGRTTDCLLEVRAFGTQPTLAEDAALYLLLVALLKYSQHNPRPLLPIAYTKVNFDQASRHGLDALLYVSDGAGNLFQRPAAAIAAEFITQAIELWRDISPEAADLVALLHPRTAPECKTPAAESLRLFDDIIQDGHTPAEAAHRVLAARVLRPQTGAV